MINKLRLLLFSECNRTCEGCCNKDFDLDKLPVATNYRPYDEIILTGGKPRLRPELIAKVTNEIRYQTNTKIILYTAKPKRALDLIAMFNYVDGITVTLHEPYDVKPFRELNDYLWNMWNISISLRLNVFKGINLTGINIDLWNVKKDIEWIKDCPLPEGEVFMRYEESGGKEKGG